MDPNAALAELRRLVASNQVDVGLLEQDPAEVERRLDRMCELVEALDNWVMGGGFLPFEWLSPGAIERRRAHQQGNHQ